MTALEVRDLTLSSPILRYEHRHLNWGEGAHSNGYEPGTEKMEWYRAHKTHFHVFDTIPAITMSRCGVLSQYLSIITGMEEVFIPVRLLMRTPPCLFFPTLDRGTDKVSIGIAELSTLPVLVADSTRWQAG